MKKRIVISGTIMLAVFILCPITSHAQAIPLTVPSVDTENATPTQAVVIATVNVYDAKIIFQDGNNIGISFDINNREGAQAGIKYAVNLIKNGDKPESRELADMKVFDEVVSLSDNTTVTKEINYEAPAYLSGIYDIFVTSQTEKGLPLGSNFAGSVNLEGNGEYVNVDDCYFSIQGGPAGKKYSIEQGVDINSSEVLSINCAVKNNFKTSQKIIPELNTYQRNVYGEKIADDKNVESIDLKAGEVGNVSYIISADSMKPQSYDGTMVFIDDSNKIISNKIFFHYIVRGNDATIQNIKLDKDYYAKGDVAKASFFITSLNDAGDITMELFLNSNNQACSDVVKKELNGGGQGDLTISINKDCANPEIAVVVKDKEGNILDQANQKIISKSLPQEEIAGGKIIEKSKASLFVLAVMCIILIIALVISLRNKKNGNSINNFIIFFLIGCGMFFGGSGIAKGDTIKVGTYWPGGITLCQTSGTCVPTFVYTVNTDKATYSVGQNVSVSASLNVYPSGNQNAVYNHPPTGCYLRASGLSGGSVCAINVYNFNAINAHFAYYTDVADLGTSSEAGNKTITFSAVGYDYNGSLQEWESSSSSTVYYNKTINFVVPANTPNNPTITDPIITGPTSGVVNTDYNFDIVSTGVNNINYYIDWDDDGIADQETVQANGNYYTFSQPGVPKTVTHKWDSLGTKTFAVRAAGPLRFGHDDTMMKTTASYLSNVVRHTIVIGNEPVVPPVLIPSSFGACGSEVDGKTFCQTPSRSKLCSAGSTASVVTLADGKWTWKCSGKNGENPVNCSAMKDCSWTEVNP